MRSGGYVLAALTTGFVFVGGGAAVATGAGGDDAEDDVALTGTVLQRAGEAALAHTGDGEVVDSEVDGDADGYYEVEVVMPDGSQVEVGLTAAFEVVGDEREAEPDDD